MRPVRSATGMKVAGSRSPSRGWFQRSSASAPRDFARHQAHLRLKDEDELVLLNGLGKRFLGVDLCLMLGRQIRIEQAMLAAARRLGAIHGDVSRPHQRFDARPMIGRNGNADRRANIDAVLRQLERFRDRQDDPPGKATDFVD